MRIFLLSSSVLPNDAAHPIQILNTVRALAELPDVETVEAWFFGLRGTESEIWARYGMTPPAGARLRAFLPGPLLGLAGRGGRLNPSRRLLHRWAWRRMLRSLAGAASLGPAAAVTRNESMTDLLAAEARRLGVPVVLELHWLKSVDRFRGWLEKSRRDGGGRPPPLSQAKIKLREFRWKEREALQRADGVICLTRGLRDTVRRWRLDRPLESLPSGVDGARFRAPEAGAAPLYDAVYAGQLYPWKGVDLLVRAVGLIPGATLALAGGNNPADVERVRAVARDCGAAERVTFLGQLPHAEVAALLARGRVCVLPLPRAGFIEARLFTSPLKLFEYAAAGRAIVASDLPSVREAVEHGESAWLVRPDDAEALAQGIRAVLDDPALAARLSAGAAGVAQAHDYSARARKLAGFCLALTKTAAAAKSGRT